PSPTCPSRCPAGPASKPCARPCPPCWHARPQPRNPRPRNLRPRNLRPRDPRGSNPRPSSPRTALVTSELRVAAEVIHRAERNGHQDRAHAGAVGRRRGEVIPLPGGEGADEQPDGEHHQEHAHGHLRTPGREAVTGPSPATFSVIPARAASRKPRPRRREQKPLCGYSGSALR